jgi:hypothetical protein
MASVNPFDLLGDENEDPEVLASTAAKPAVAKPVVKAAEAKPAAKGEFVAVIGAYRCQIYIAGGL